MITTRCKIMIMNRKTASTGVISGTAASCSRKWLLKYHKHLATVHNNIGLTARKDTSKISVAGENSFLMGVLKSMHDSMSQFDIRPL